MDLGRRGKPGRVVGVERDMMKGEKEKNNTESVEH